MIKMTFKLKLHIRVISQKESLITFGLSKDVQVRGSEGFFAKEIESFQLCEEFVLFCTI